MQLYVWIYDPVPAKTFIIGLLLGNCFFSVLIIQYCLFDCCRESRNVLICHGLRSSASPVLTATGVVNGRGQFLTPTESTPLDRSPKNLLLMITSATPMAVPNLVLIHPHRSSERRSCWHMTDCTPVDTPNTLPSLQCTNTFITAISWWLNNSPEWRWKYA